MKRLISIVIAIILSCSSLIPFYAYAGVKQESATASLLQQGNFSDGEIIAESYQLSTVYPNLEEFKSYVYQKLSESSSYFNIKSYGIKRSDISIIYSNVINDNPDLFYVSSSIKYSYNDKTNVVSSLYPNYAVEGKDLTKARSIYQKGFNYALGLVDENMDDVQKALVIHDYLCLIATYPLISNNSDDKQIFHSAYGMFYDRTVVCAGYALAYSAILNYLGIPCKYVISDTMMHAWNIVQINGKWYNVDLTYDDLYNTLGENAHSMIAHSCFLKSTAAMCGNIGVWHKDIIYPDGITCDDTTYDNAFWNDINSNIPVVNGDYYYIDCDRSNLTIKLLRRDRKGNTSLVTTDNYNTGGIGRIATNPNDSNDKHYFYIYFSPLMNYNRRLYFSYVNYKSSSSKNGVLQAINSNGTDNRMIMTLDDNNVFLALGENKGDLLYLPRINDINADPVTKLRGSAFDEAYKNNSYNLYADANNDGVNNAKDYALIYNNKY